MTENEGVVRPRPAATVMLMRPMPAVAGASEERPMEVLLMRRVPSMGFAPGAYVFPGGRVDERDADGDLPWTGPAPEEWSRTLGVDVPMARALVCAAVRETFEETGVLLASEPEHASDTAITLDTDTEDWERDRLGLIDRSRSFTEVLSRRGLVLRSEWLRAWSRWITPAREPRRYDTWFFTAELPPGQQPRDVGGEADHTQWVDPRWWPPSGTRDGCRCCRPQSSFARSWRTIGPSKVYETPNGISFPSNRRFGRWTDISVSSPRTAGTSRCRNRPRRTETTTP